MAPRLFVRSLSPALSILTASIGACGAQEDPDACQDPPPITASSGPCDAAPGEPACLSDTDAGQQRDAGPRQGTDLGSVTFWPGPDYVVDPASDAFCLSLRYRPPAAGLAPGTVLEIIPFAHRHRGTAQAWVEGPDGSSDVEVHADDTYSSRSQAEPAATVRFEVPLPDSVAPDESLVFHYETDRLMRAHYTLAGPCREGFSIRLRAADGNLIGQLPAPIWAFATAPPRKLAAILPSQASVDEEVPLIVRVTGTDAPTFDFSDTVVIEAQPHVEVLPGARFALGRDDAGVKRLRVRFAEPGLYRLGVSTEAQGMSATSYPIRVGAADQIPIYWGVMHWHTRYSWDSRNYQPTCMGVADALRFAREASLLDFMSVSDHGQHGDPRAFDTSDPREPQVDMPLEDWEAYTAETLDFDEAAEDIIAFIGYEHRDPRGDTNVLFRAEAGYFLEDGRRLFIDDVWRRAGSGDDLLTFPQLHLQGELADYRTASPHERLVEIRSFHAAFEYYLNPQPFPAYNDVEVKHGQPGDRVFVQELLGLGRRLGFVANDDHGDLPGNAGVTAVYAPKRSHDAIFDSMLARHVYATTGARILVDLRMGSLSMGDERLVEADDPLADTRVLSFEVHGTSTIQALTLLRNNQPIHELPVDDNDFSGTYEDSDPLSAIVETREVGDVRSAYYYLRVRQDDGETAWSSPIFLLAE